MDAAKHGVGFLGDELMHHALGRHDQVRSLEVLLTVVVLHRHCASGQQCDVIKRMGMALMRVTDVKELVHLDEDVVDKF